MKRLISLMIAAALFLTAACAAADGVKFSTDYFTLDLPNNWEIDTEGLEQQEDGEKSLGFFYDNENIGLIGAAYLVYYEELKDFALWNASEAEVKDYADALLEEFEGKKAELVGVINAGKIPLVLVKCTDDDGEFLYADTITNGYAIEFEFYVMDADGKTMYPITEQHIEQVKTVLATLQPAA
jgi:hypothetical protein